MAEDKYFASQISVEADRERLSLLEQTWDATTVRHLDTLGVARGWTCLEVGAGYGSITRVLAERVGTQGKVMATDIRPALHRAGTANVEIRQHDILQDGMEREQYDLVHCRALLQHLGDPAKAALHMAEAVKPGGWLLIEEFDSTVQRSIDSSSPSGILFDKYLAAAWEISKSRQSAFDPSFGRRVRSILEGLGFDDVAHEGTELVVRGGEPWAISVQMTFRAARGLITGTLSEEERKARELREQFDRLMHDPSFFFVSNTLFSAWGKKPENWMAK